jgi:hypothetical protein
MKLQSITIPMHIYTVSDDLKPEDAMVYGVILAYANVNNGMCEAPRADIGRESRVKARALTSSLTRLQSCGLINIFGEMKRPTHIDPLIKFNVVVTPEENKPKPKEEAVKAPEQIYDPLFCLDQALGATPNKRVYQFYSTLFKSKYGFFPKVGNWAVLGKTIKTLLNEYSEYQIALLLLIHFDWHGATGGDDFAHKRLQEACFPLTWLPNNANTYEAFIRNTHRIAFEVPEEVRHAVVQSYKKIQ